MTTPTTLRWPRRFPCRALLALLGIATLPGDRALAQTDPDVDTIVAAWNQHLSTLGCVKYVVEGTEFFPKDSIEPGFPAEDFTAPRKTTLWIDFANNRLRKEITRHEAHIDERVIRQAYTVFMFDGTDGWEDRPRAQNAEWYQGESLYASNLKRTAPAESSHFLDGGDLAILLAERMVHRWSPSIRSLTEPLSPAEMRLHGWGEGRDGRFLVVRPSASSGREIDEFWVDSEKDFTIVHYIRRNETKERHRIDLSYHRVKSAWRLRAFERRLSGRLVLDMRVVSREAVANPDIELFSRAPHDGDYVWDNSTKERYLLKAGEKHDVRQVYLADQRRRSLRRPLLWGVGLAAILLLAACARFALRRKRT